MNNIEILKTNINVSKILAQLKQYPEDWGAQTKMENTDSMLNYGFPEVEAGVLQLVMGGITSPEQYVGDTELCICTPAYYKHTEIVGFIKRHFKQHSRMGFLSLPVGGSVGTHIDVGDYYLTRDRYHLSVQGEYEYTVGDEMVLVKPGTLLRFNNKLPHGTKNVGNEVRITFVFDIPSDPKYKQHLYK